jgi:tetratricopeptide (TPR) repeat protein
MNRLCCLLLVFAPVAAARSPIESLVLNGDWEAIGRAVATAPWIPGRLLLAHASLAARDVNAPSCGFSSVSSPADLEQWEAWTSRLVHKAPDSAVAHYHHGDTLARLPQFDGALAEFGRALHSGSRYSLALNARGVVYALTCRYDPALMALSDASAADPRFANAPLNRGCLYLMRSCSADARLNAIENALKIRPGFALDAPSPPPESWSPVSRSTRL